MDDEDAAVFLCTRNELYSLVWETPPAQLSKRFAISDVGLAKLCRRHNIPLPYRGYWARVAAGQTPSKAQLPTGSDTKISLALRSEGEKVEENDCEIAAAVEAANSPEGIVVPTDLASAHEITKKIRGKLWKLKSDDYGRLVAEGGNKLVAWVGRAQMDRALRIVDAIIRGCERRNYRVSYDGYCGVSVGIGAQEMPVLVEEVSTRSETPAEEILRARTYRSRYTYTPSGKLNLKIDRWTTSGRGVRRNWSDTSRSKIEDRLSEFFPSVAALAIYLQRDADESARQRSRWEEEERLRREHERAAGQLKDVAQRLQQINMLRAAVLAMEQSGVEMSTPIAGFSSWKEWVANYIGRLDPLKNIRLGDPNWYPSHQIDSRFLP